MKQTGFTCDRQACGTFVIADSLPEGWLVLRPNITSATVKQDTVTLEFCSNVCLAITAADRALGLDDTDVVPMIRKSRKNQDDVGIGARLLDGASPGTDQGSFARHVRWHVNRNKVEEGCEHCVSATAPNASPVRTPDADLPEEEA